MLATPGPLPTGPGWGFEFAWDGVRALAAAGPGGVRLSSGTGRELTAGFPELGALAGGYRMLLDGKLVALDTSSRPGAAELRRRLTVRRPTPGLLRRVPVGYYVFDVLSLDGRATVALPYLRRRELLDELLDALGLDDGPVVLAPSFPEADGSAVLDTAARFGLPGVVAKRLGSTYRPGRRSRAWVETALRQRQQVVLGGWVPGEGGRLGSLLLGVPDAYGLRYVGQVGTGFTDVERRRLARLLADAPRDASPFLDALPSQRARVARWVAPALVGEVEHRQWSDGRLRHAAWRGLRRDVDPAAVRAPVRLPAPPGRPAPTAHAEREHFLYNTLTTIAAFVRTDPPRARELLIEFADYTRYSSRPGGQSTTLGEELRNVERYLAVEQARFGARLRVRLDVAPEVLTLGLPSLAVQPLVEDAVRRGIEPTPGGGTLSLSAAPAGAGCEIVVRDDGAPHPAVVGVHERLRAAFGDGYRLTVEAGPGAGTTVTLRVPPARSPGARVS